MKLLHTSDWHLGQNFMGKSREEEHHAFLAWLLNTIESQEIEVLIVAGDIFDTGTPPNYALELYYNFLTKLSALSSCGTVIITAGNHDSVATLKAPKQLLKALNVHVITSGDETEDELVSIYKKETLQAIVCAVPFLRDTVVRKAVSSQTSKGKENALTEGIKEHYDSVYAQAKKLSDDVPIIATGHLTTVGSTTSDSEREIYIGGTLEIGSDFLGKHFDYVALGHLHTNQKVGQEHVCYSGSPIPLSFSEAKGVKKVNIVTFEKKDVLVETLNIPLHRPLVLIKGDLDKVTAKLHTIEDKSSWIEVHLNDANSSVANQSIRQLAQELDLLLLAVKIETKTVRSRSETLEHKTLDQLTPMEVFNYRLELDGIKEDTSMTNALLDTFKNIENEVSTS